MINRQKIGVLRTDAWATEYQCSLETHGGELPEYVRALIESATVWSPRNYFDDSETTHRASWNHAKLFPAGQAEHTKLTPVQGEYDLDPFQQVSSGPRMRLSCSTHA